MQVLITVISFILINCPNVLCIQNLFIWDINQTEFIQVSSLPHFEKRINFSSAEECCVKDFNGQEFKLAYNDQTNMITYDENTHAFSGIYGDIWRTIAEHRNFTIQPLKNPYQPFGHLIPSGEYDGLIGLVHRNEGQILPRATVSHVLPLKFTLPFWRTSYSFYIKQEKLFDKYWILELLAPNLWFFVFCILLSLSLAGYISQKVSLSLTKDANEFTFSDHIFFSISICFLQGYTPVTLYNRSRIICALIIFYSWTIYLFFTSHTIVYLMHTETALPFGDLNSLISKTDYTILTYRGGSIIPSMQNEIARLDKHGFMAKRVQLIDSLEELYATVCVPGKRYALFASLDGFLTSGHLRQCDLISVGPSYFHTWVSSGIFQGLTYRNTFDSSISRFFEVGIMNFLKHRWFQDGPSKMDDHTYHPIHINQMYLVFAIPLIGMLLAMCILIIEMIVYFSHQKVLKARKKQ